MDPVTGVGLAASLATLGEIAGKSSKALYRFAKCFRDAPEALKELCEEVESLKFVLDDFSALIKHELGDDDVGPRVKEFAERKHSEMATDLTSFARWVNDLLRRFDEPKSSEWHLKARLMKALSERSIIRHKRALAEHRGFLDTLLAQIATRQLSQLAGTNGRSFTSVFAYFDSIQKDIDGISSAVQQDNPALKRIEDRLECFEEHLLKLGSHLKSQSHSTTPCTSHTLPQPAGEDVVATKVQKTLWWNWSVFALPIGTLSVEASEVEPEWSEDRATAALAMSRKAFRSCVKFLPATWISDIGIAMSQGISFAGTDMPEFWCSFSASPLRSRDVVPSAFIAAFRDGNPYSISSFLLETNRQILDILFSQHRRKFETKTAIGDRSWLCIWWTLQNDVLSDVTLRSGSSFSVTLHEALSSCLHFPDSQKCMACKEQFNESEKQSLVTFSYGVPLQGSFLDGTERLVSGCPSSAPTFLISSSDGGYRSFLRDILPHMDLSTFQDLGTVDRWWFTALDHNDKRFGATIQAELESYSNPSGSHRRTPKSHRQHLWPYFDSYDAVVQEVLSSRRSIQQNMLSMICAIGNSLLLRPFIELGYDFRTPLAHTDVSGGSYVSVATRCFNFDTLELLISSGYAICGDELIYMLREMPILTLLTVQHVEKVIDLYEGSLFSQSYRKLQRLHSLLPHITTIGMISSSVFASGMDIFAISLLAANIRFTEEVSHTTALSLYRRLSRKGIGHFARPPYSRSMFLGPEMIYVTLCHMDTEGHPASYTFGEKDMIDILLQLGASLDYKGPEKAATKLSALEWAVELGYERVIQRFIDAEKNFKNITRSVTDALNLSRECLEREHPRKWPVQLSDLYSDLKSNNAYLNELEVPKSSFEEIHHETCGVSLQTDLRCAAILEAALVSIIKHSPKDGPDERIELTKALERQSSREFRASKWRLAFRRSSETVRIAMYKIKRRLENSVEIIGKSGQWLRRRYRAPFQDYLIGIIGLVLILVLLLLHKLLHFGIWTLRQRRDLRSFAPLFLFLLIFLWWR